METEKKGNHEEAEWVQEIPVCPVCGSDRRFFESIGEELKQRGLLSDDTESYYEMKAGAVGSKGMIAKLVIGASVPAFGVGTDICLGYPDKPCGNIYAVRIERTNVKKSLAPIQILPNRAQRRHGGNGGFGFPPVNSRM